MLRAGRKPPKQQTAGDCDVVMGGQHSSGPGSKRSKLQEQQDASAA